MNYLKLNKSGNPRNLNKIHCNIDDLTSKAIGEFGWWQLRISVLMALLKLPMAWYQLNIIFMAPPQEFWCEKPKSFEQYTTKEWRKMSAPFTQCVMMCGVLFGGIVIGIIADKYGRKMPLMISIAVQAIASLLISVVPWFWCFLVVWFILALASGGLGIISFVICMEVVGGKWRTTIPVLYHLPFGLGNTVMAALAYWLRDWRTLEFALAVISSFFILYWLVIPESPRWLLAKGRTVKALEVMEAAAKMNGKSKDFIILKKRLSACEQPKVEAPGFLAFIHSKDMRLKTLLLSSNWFCTGLEFYTFSQYFGTIGENIFVTVALTGILSVPGGILCVYIITRYGRKTTVWFFQAITALCFLLILFIPKDVFTNDWPRLLIAGIGFAGMAGTVPALYLLSGELFPTLGRNAGVGGVTIFARIASMIAPIIVSLDGIVSDLPLIILSIVSIGQLFLLVPLPETKDKPLPDTLEEAERFKR